MNRKQFLLTLLLAIISAFLGGTLGVWFLMPPSVLAQDEPPKVIEAQEFRVVNEAGNISALLTNEYIGIGPMLVFFREEDKPTILLSGDEVLPTLLFYGKNNVARGSFMLASEREGLSIKLQDERGNLRANLGATSSRYEDKDRAPSSLVLFDEEGKVVWSAP